MLTSLTIKNFAIIDELEVEFGPGLNVMTGETGAGKTIILQALDLLLGARASGDLIRSGKDSASVTACFLLQKEMLEIKQMLETIGIEFDEELILHRTMTMNGKGKISINGIPTTGQFLKMIGSHLVDISSQHEHQLLLDPTHHVTILDRYGNLRDELNRYQEALRQYHFLRGELDVLKAREKAAREQYDFLLFQYQELRETHLKEGEEEELEAERNRSKHGVKLKTHLHEILQFLSEKDESALDGLSKSSLLLEQAAEFDSTLLLFQKRLAICETEVSDVVRDLQRYAQQMDVDPDRLETIEDRLHLFRLLKKKYGGSVESCLQKQTQLETELKLVEQGEELTTEREEAVATAKKELHERAQFLAIKRHKVATKLSEKISQELAELGMKRTTFQVSFMAHEEEAWDQHGSEETQFLISPNSGEALRPLSKIASGGELSRVLLAVKNILSDRALAATSIFDEVDAGIGGAIAEVVGKKLRDVARLRQVICITHLPQVAAYGEHHFCITKKAFSGRTVTHMHILKRHERLEEIARMLAGVEVTEIARKHAAELLKVPLEGRS